MFSLRKLLIRKKFLIKINNYTDYIYLHVKGEPLIHHKLKEIFIKYSYALDDKEKLKYISDYCSDELKKIILNNK